MSAVQLALDRAPASEPGRGMQEWRGDYSWLDRAFGAIGPGALGASDRWRIRIEDELKTTLDFKVRPDGTAAVWCGMSGHDFHHDPTPKELLGGLAEAYRLELERVRGRPTAMGTLKKSADPPTGRRYEPVVIGTNASDRSLRAPEEDSLTRALEAVLVPRVAQLVLVFVAVTALTLVMSAVANAVR